MVNLAARHCGLVRVVGFGSGATEVGLGVIGKGFWSCQKGPEVCPVSHGELAIYLVQCVVDGADGNDEPLRDRLAGQPASGHRGDFQLTGGEIARLKQVQGGRARAFALRGKCGCPGGGGLSRGPAALSLKCPGSLGSSFSGEQVEAEGGEAASDLVER